MYYIWTSNENRNTMSPVSINVINVRYPFFVMRHHFSPFTICFDLSSVICSRNMIIVAYHPLDDHSPSMYLVDLCSCVFRNLLANNHSKAIILPQFRFIVRLSWPQYNNVGIQTNAAVVYNWSHLYFMMCLRPAITDLVIAMTYFCCPCCRHQVYQLESQGR